MRDRVVIGVFDDDTHHKLLAIVDLTLANAVKICRAEEAATVTSIRIPATATATINAAKKSTYQRSKTSTSTASTKSRNSTEPPKCPNCGRTAHTKSPCPAEGQTCSACKGIGHFSAMCRKSKRKPPNSDRKIAHLKLQRTSLNPHTVRIDTQLDSEPTTVPLVWLPDTGSDVDAVGARHLEQLGGFLENLQPVYNDVRTADGTSLKSFGSIPVTLTSDGRQHVSTLHVYDGLDDALLSRQSLEALRFLPKDWPQHVLSVQPLKSPTVPLAPTAADIERIRGELLTEFADVFDAATLKPMAAPPPPMDIVLEPDAKPHCVYTARPIPYAYRDHVKEQLDTMVADGIIEPVSEPSDWCHPIVIVNKKGSTEKRLTVDLQTLSRQVKRPTHPMSTARSALSGMGSAKWFTKLDARHGYTFITPWSRFRYCRNPQGLKSAGDEFNRRTDAAFAGIPNLVKVVDDGRVHDDSFQEHYARVRAILICARENSITLSAKKFIFGVHEVEFCGFSISADGYVVDPAKVSAIQDFPLPSNHTDLRSFFGLVNQCVEVTPRLAEVSALFRPLLKTSCEFM